VAMLYQRDKFRYIGHRSVPVKTSRRNDHPIRDILHVWGEIITGDTLDLAICHFPSKYGGEKESEKRRIRAAEVLSQLNDSLMSVRNYPLIIMMGDFNDPPESKSMHIVTGKKFHNLFSRLVGGETKGSHKYQGEWSQLDQIIVNMQMLSSGSRMRVIPESVVNFSAPFLFINDKTWRGKRPHRTYYGFKYEGGYSDHLPVIADFLLSLP